MLMMVVAAMVIAGPVLAQEEPTTPAPEETPVPAATPEEPAAPEAAAPEEAPAEPAAEPAAAEEEAAPQEPAGPSEPAVPTVYRDKTMVEVRGKAENNGQLKLVFEPNGEDGTVVTINIVERTNAKKITNEIEQQLKFAVDPRYVVKRKGDRQILVKGKKGAPAAAIKIESQALSGVAVMISRG
jgi:hypothetical protein